MADLVMHAGPRGTAQTPADRITIWPLDAGRFGIDVTYEGASGYELASRHERMLEAAGISYSFRQELGGAWTVRLTLPASAVAETVTEFVASAI